MTRHSRGDCGYVFVAADDDGPMSGAEPGNIVSMAGPEPPWIVVAWDFKALNLNWPGRLLRVRIREAAVARQQPPASARYTRAASVLVEAEEDAAQLFGEFGSAVVEVLETALRMDRALAETLAAHRHEGAAAANDRAWRRWLDRLGVAHDNHSDLSDTLRFGGPVNDSPINDGLLAVYDVVYERARAVDGDSAFDHDDEDMWLLPPWSDACGALRDAALALGAPDIVAPEDRAILLAGWRSIAGRGSC